jgi:hypothetical protein
LVGDWKYRSSKPDKIVSLEMVQTEREREREKGKAV